MRLVNPKIMGKIIPLFMRKCLAPFFIGREEPGLDRRTGPFDVVLPKDLVGTEPGSIRAINQINCSIRDVVAETILSGDRPLVLSGDCLSAIGCLAGMEKCGIRPYLLWFDAHGDFHTPETTISGHLGGMPLAIITGRSDGSLLSDVGLTPLADDRVCLIGGRDLEPVERESLEASGIRRVDRVAQALEFLPESSPLWVHFDTDYINPSDAPAMRYPAPGGISAKAVKFDLETIARKRNVLGLSVSAWAPHLDTGGRTAATCWDTISIISLGSKNQR
jgi:arginase